VRSARKTSPVRVVAAPDKFRGTATAAEVAAAVSRAAARCGWDCDEVPMADGGEGTLAVLGGPNRTTVVSGPLGDPVRAGWRLHRGTAVIEVAHAIGLALAGGPDGNAPVAASTHGAGELIGAAVDAGAKRIIVCVGGSATTDGGLGAMRALFPAQRLRGVELLVACDVRTTFLDAAPIFAPQKGASAAQVELLRRRLERLAQVYRDEHGVDVTDLPGSGAAGGLAGGLAALGARLVPGFDLVVTGEGFLDAQTFEGKVVGGVVELAGVSKVPVVAVAGEVFDGVDARVDTVSLVARFGEDRALTDTAACIEEAVADVLRSRA